MGWEKLSLVLGMPISMEPRVVVTVVLVLEVALVMENWDISNEPVSVLVISVLTGRVILFCPLVRVRSRLVLTNSAALSDPVVMVSSLLVMLSSIEVGVGSGMVMASGRVVNDVSAPVVVPAELVALALA